MRKNMHIFVEYFFFTETKAEYPSENTAQYKPFQQCAV